MKCTIVIGVCANCAKRIKTVDGHPVIRVHWLHEEDRAANYTCEACLDGNRVAADLVLHDTD